LEFTIKREEEQKIFGKSLAWPCKEYKKSKLGMVTQTHYPSYSGGRDWDDHITRLGWVKMLVRPHLNK
jgi:hypothetical protein